LQYEEMTETASFKSTMTALGCGILLLVPAVLSVLLVLGWPLGPWSLILILPLLLIFLGLQTLRWIVPAERAAGQRSGEAGQPVPPA
jgi:hypothetical protein